MELKVGQVIVARPDMPDPFFDNSVIVILAHTQDGTLGLNVAGFMGDNLEPPFDGCKVFDGGPVDGTAIALHKADLAVDGSQPLDDTGYVFTCLQLDANRKAQPADLIRREGVEVVVGYSGWAMGELEGEMLMGAWAVSPASLEAVLAAPAPERWNVAAKDATFTPFAFGPLGSRS
jgi:putative transcriptional regulator